MIRTRIDMVGEVPTYLSIKRRMILVDNGDQYRPTMFSFSELESIVAFARKAGIFPSSDSCPAPAESEGVQAEAKRSPKGCLDAEANAGHCAPMVTERDEFSTEPMECAWLFHPGVTHPVEASCA